MPRCEPAAINVLELREVIVARAVGREVVCAASQAALAISARVGLVPVILTLLAVQMLCDVPPHDVVTTAELDRFRSIAVEGDDDRLRRPLLTVKVRLNSPHPLRAGQCLNRFVLFLEWNALDDVSLWVRSFCDRPPRRIRRRGVITLRERSWFADDDRVLPNFGRAE